jgi:hypothetical protein
MITAFIFFAHLVFALIIYTKKWQDDGIKSAILNVVLIGILFTVGWSITGIVAKLIMDQKGFGLQFDRDAFSLTLLMIGEFFFYRIYYEEPAIADDKEKQ